jgi:RIO kinase 1
VINAERDIKLAKSGKEDLIYKTLIGLKADLSKPAETPEILANKYKQGNGDMKIENDSFENTADSDSEINSEIESENENKSKFVNSARPRNESPESKKVKYVLFYYFYILFNIIMI